MILVKKIEYIETDRDPIDIISMVRPNYPVRVGTEKGAKLVEVSEIHELIKGRRFVRPSTQTDIVIGMSKQASEVIGIQYETFDNMEESIAQLTSQQRVDRETLDKIKSASLLKRLTWLFTGVK